MAGKMAKQLAGSGTGQSLMDRVTQAKYSLAGSALGKVIAKASTEELIAPKKKHLENLVRLSNEPNVSIPLLVNFLLERTREKSWVIVFKALITTHHLLNYGNELLKSLPVLRDQLNVLFEFEATEKDLNNLIINAAFILLYKDLIRLFASYNEGMMNLVEKYFTMKRSQCKTALELYKDFPNVMTKVDEFLTVAEHLGIGDKESMGLHPVPPQIVDAMEQHLVLLQKKKKANGHLDDEDEESAKISAEHHTSTRPPLPKSKPHASPARSKSPVRPATSPKVAVSRTKPVEQESNTAFLAGLTDVASVADPIHVVPPQTEVIVTDPDGEQREPEEEDDGLSADKDHEQQEEEDAESTGERRHEEEYEEDEDSADGLPSEQQEAIIAAATSHFIQSADRTNQAVKSSVALTPRQTRKFTKEPESGAAACTASLSRSRSPSPARPLPPRSASPVHPPASPEHSSPFHKKPEPEAKADIAIDDLLGFGDDIPVAQPSPAVQPIANISKPVTSQSKPHSVRMELLNENNGGEMAATRKKKEHCQLSADSLRTPEFVRRVHGMMDENPLDDLLSLDPLLDTGSDPTPVPAPIVSSTSESTGLPAGLKPTPADVVVRPAVVTQKKKENALDQLDTTLASLASSLGGSSSNWGSGAASKGCNRCCLDTNESLFKVMGTGRSGFNWQLTLGSVVAKDVIVYPDEIHTQPEQI
ncbi:unnamed protein product [Hymenolepis diminuta]|uniref:ENTH domain-containing protein n=1 Tax=Hymenolepis diminuta TaxID=6216 RepID=A0A158QCG1_HYMDI|nr:unnamed protein product [Hymenolepis diminuta]